MNNNCLEDYPLDGKRVWVAGDRGMVGAALVRRLASEPCEVLTSSRSELDLRRQEAVEEWLRRRRPDVIFICAARVGGILSNDTRPVDFLYDNLLIEANIIKTAFDVGVEKLMFLGSSCIYPRMAAQPISEDALLTGAFEPTNRWYALAKVAGVMLCEAYRKQFSRDFISVLPTNLYGPGDNFELASTHVIPALIRKAHEAKVAGSEMEVWGTGTPRREFLYVDDLADALVFIMKKYSGDIPLNVGVGSDTSIAELSHSVCNAVGFSGTVRFDTSKPDGTPRKLLDVSKLTKLGWTAQTPLEQGLRQTYDWFLRQKGSYRGCDRTVHLNQKRDRSARVESVSRRGVG
jgi:GDP-L-fucose synthase